MVSNKAVEIDWSVFFGSDGGHAFEEMCGELLKSMDMDVNIRTNPDKGSDGGRDIIVFEKNVRPSQMACIVECKSRVSKSPPSLKAKDLHAPFFFVLQHRVNKLLIITNHVLHAHFINTISSVNENDFWGLKIVYIEKSELEEILQGHTDIYETVEGKVFPREYFLGEPPKTSSHATSSLRNFIIGQSDGKHAVISYRNLSALPEEITVLRNGEQHLIQTVDPLSCSVIRLPVGENGRAHDYVVQTKDADCPVQMRGLAPLGIPIDKIYIDPRNKLSALQQIDSLETNLVFVSGHAGTGKTRLLQEFAAKSDKYLWFDMVANDLESHVVSAIFDLASSKTEEFPDEMLETFLINRGLNEAQANALAKHTNGSELLPQDASIAILTECFVTLFSNHDVIIDNLHRASIYDANLLKSIAADSKSPSLITSARFEEFAQQEVEVLVKWLGENNKAHTIEVDDYDVALLIKGFLELAAQNDATKAFLKPLISAESFQGFIFALKDIKARGLLTQDVNGTFSINTISDHLSTRDYEALYNSIISLLKKQNPETADSIDHVVGCAAVFGSSIPFEFLLEICGEDGNSAIDVLVRAEVLKPDHETGHEGLWLKFDHELTHEVAYNMVPFTRRQRLHKQAIDFIKDGERYRHGFDDGRLADHYNAIGDIADEINSRYAHGNYLQRQGHYEDAIKSLELAICASTQSGDNERYYEEEGKSLDLLLTLHRYAGSSIDRFQNRLSSLQTLLLLMGPSAPNQLQIRADLHRVYALEKNGKYNEALSQAQACTKAFELEGLFLDSAESRMRASVIYKKRGNYQSALAELRHLFRKLAHKDNLDAMQILGDACLNVGGTLLESERCNAVVWWWDRAVSYHVRGGNTGKLAYALADRAYAYALFKPSHTNVEQYLREALMISRRFQLKSNVCRTYLNSANWHFFIAVDSNSAKEDLDKADEIAEALNDIYMKALVHFSRLNFRSLSNVWDLNTSMEFVELFLIERLRTLSSIDELGDQRMRNMLLYFLSIEGTVSSSFIDALPSVFAKSLMSWQNKIHIGSAKNPFYMGDGTYATFF